MNLSPAQIKALRMINENPGNVVADRRFSQRSDVLQINIRTEQALVNKGMIEQYELHRRFYFQQKGETHAVEKINMWRLTDKGRKAITENQSRFAQRLSRELNEGFHL